ncbi:MAG: hypothetical protein LBS34_00910 [Rickettsiales bacterium]|jgi:hypothetical protein|nr:hypothetical protein [Rickettsiales bacterium]
MGKQAREGSSGGFGCFTGNVCTGEMEKDGELDKEIRVIVDLLNNVRVTTESIRAKVGGISGVVVGKNKPVVGMGV